MSTLPYIPPHELTAEEAKLYQLNLSQLTEKYNRAVMRSNYYNTKEMLKDIGFSIPPNMRTMEAVLGWPAKAVNGLSGRLKLAGIVDPKSGETNEDLDYLFALNRMSLEWPMSQVSTLLHGCSFVATTPGDTEAGEPEVMIQTMPATEATGIWDVRRRGLSSALWQPDMDSMNKTRAVLFTLKNTIEMTREAMGPWKVRRIPNKLDRLPVTLVAHRPQLTRPFGQSRISRPVMYLTQMAMRTLLRTEVSAEFYSSPQRYAMGASPEDFTDEEGNTVTAWETILGKIWLMGKDEEGDAPTVGQFQQMSMAPHGEMLKLITTMFAGETSLPVSSLGIVHDNPASAEAIDAAWADMVTEAELCQTELALPIIEIAQNALMLKRNISELPKELVMLQAKWRDASTPTRAAMADAVAKDIGSGMLLPTSKIALEKSGYTPPEIAQIQAEHKAAKEEQARLDAKVMSGGIDAPADPGAEKPQPDDAGGPPKAVGSNVAPAGRPPGR